MRRIVFNENVYYVDEVSRVDMSWQIGVASGVVSEEG